MLNQIIFSHTGLSVGEIETINNLFIKNGFDITENTLPIDSESAGILDLELPINRDIDFFDFISIESWSFLIDILKNIKKRRGKKLFRFKLTFDYYTYDLKSGDLFFFKKIIFLLNHREEIDFNKGLERMELAIEKFSEILRQGIPKTNKSEYSPLEKNDQDARKCIENDDEVIVSILIFDMKKRSWKSI